MPLTSTSTRIRRSGAGALVAAMMLATPAAAAAGAAGTAPATDALCTNVITLHIAPGFSMRATSGTVTSRGATGTLLCAVRLDGQPITGLGTFSVEETYTNATCLADASTGHVAATIPTATGPKHISGALTGRRLGLVEFVEIVFPNARFSATGLVLPTRGDCLLTPITTALVSVTGTLRG